MKSAFAMTLANVVMADNSTPIQPTLPGWQLGTKGAEVEIRVFYDMLCPDSRDAHYVWKD